MSEQKVPRSVEQRIVIKFLVGENVPSAEIHRRLQQQYGEECLLRRHSSPYCCYRLYTLEVLHFVDIYRPVHYNVVTIV